MRAAHTLTLTMNLRLAKTQYVFPIHEQNPSIKIYLLQHDSYLYVNPYEHGFHFPSSTQSHENLFALTFNCL